MERMILKRRRICSNNDFVYWLSGPSGSGKTNMVCHLIRQCIIPYSSITKYTKHKEQKLFKDLQSMMDQLSKRAGCNLMKILDGEDIPNTREYDNEPNCNECIIFNDLINSNNKILKRITDHFIEGRHSGLLTIFITQDYHQTPRGYVRTAIT